MVLEILEACQSLGHDPSFKCKIVVLLDNQEAIKVSGHDVTSSRVASLRLWRYTVK